MAADDIAILKRELPQLFDDQALPGNWDDDWLVVPVTDPLGLNTDDIPELAQVVDTFQNEASDAWLAPGVSSNFPWVPATLAAPAPGSPQQRDLWGNGGFQPPPDALAFYLPFHYYYPTWWGVYVTLEGVVYLADFIRRSLSGRILWADALGAAKLFLYEHEAYHHKVECFAMRLEVGHRVPLYHSGFDDLYVRHFGTDDSMEEALATAAAYRSVTSRWKHRADAKHMVVALQEYIHSLPPGYRQALNVARLFKRHERRFAEDNHEECFPYAPGVSPETWRVASQMFRGISQVNSRVNYLVRHGSPLAARLRLGTRFLRYRDVAQRLRDLAGCEETGVAEGSHVKWRAPNGRTFPVPRHPGDLRKGTLSAILKQAGLRMSISEFVAAARKAA